MKDNCVCFIISVYHLSVFQASDPVKLCKLLFSPLPWKEARQQSIHYKAVDYPLFEITQWAKSPRLALRGTVHVGVIIQSHKKPQKHLSRREETQPQMSAEGLFQSGCHILSLFILSQVLVALIGLVVFVYTPEEAVLWPARANAGAEAAAGRGPIIDRL